MCSAISTIHIVHNKKVTKTELSCGYFTVFLNGWAKGDASIFDELCEPPSRTESGAVPARFIP